MYNDKNKINSLCNELSNWIKKERKILFRLNKSCSNDTEYWITKDFEFILLYLASYYKNNYRIINKLLKPKGNIIIMLSFNEPFVMSIVPVLNSLIAGNNVIVRPSRKCLEFFEHIWRKSGIMAKYNLNLEVFKRNDPLSLEKKLSKVQALYFFGGHDNAKKVAQLCSKHFVEFYPEIETSDFKVVKQDNSAKLDLSHDIETTIQDSFTHSGQSCQRIQGVFLHKTNYNEYANKIKQAFKKLLNSNELSKYISEDFQVSKDVCKQLNDQITKSSPKEVIRNKSEPRFPILVLEPNPKSKFVRSAYFLPILWIASYSSEKELIDLINSRMYHLGINIQTGDEEFKKRLIESTNFTRYTVNTNHSEIRLFEGWGGAWPSGYLGYRNWIEFFSNPYTIIENTT